MPFDSRRSQARSSDEPSPIGAAGRPVDTATHILYFAPQTCRTLARTGIQRVVMQSALALLPLAIVDFVRWDPIEGQLRYFNGNDLDVFFQSRTWHAGVRVNRFAERRSYRFEDVLPAVERSRIWLMMPEISYHMPAGADICASMLAQVREYRIRTAAIFYDLIPITNRDYQRTIGEPHTRYVRDLLGVDLVMPISMYSSDELVRYQAERLGVGEEERRRIRHVVAPVPLATVNSETRADDRAAAAPLKSRDLVILLGTVEPRKRQVEVLRAFKARRLAERFGLRVVVIGSLHPAVADAFRELAADDASIEYVGYADEERVRALFGRARFSAFASNDEGFGLPICESLAHGVPCLAADFGAMREVGEGGGCLLLDVNDEVALADGLERMAADDALIERLRGEIATRVFRTWEDYARDVLRLMTEHPGDGRERSTFEAEVRAAVRASLADGTGTTALSFDGEPWTVTGPGALGGQGSETSAPAEGSDIALVLSGARFDPEEVGAGALAPALEADAWAFDDVAAYEGLIAQASAAEFPGLLPTRCVIAPNSELPEAAAAAVGDLAAERARRHLIAERERLLRRAGGASTASAGRPVLSIVISTYNRGPFVAENVRWLLSHLRRYDGRIALTVVDNASSDDTEARLAPHREGSGLEYVRNTANVGMLGNLQVCSALHRARHTWVIGDDDFIVPSALDAVLDVVGRDPYLPFAFINFGVYHRAALEPGDCADTLIVDPIRLAPQPSPTGFYPVREIAAEHDNLFTAIYPIVFRTDILSACFNYPFNGVPFSSLVESIPTTKIILESYARTEAWWLGEVGIVGNAHNSWQRYRVRWHGALMPLAFELAREAGVDSRKLHAWARLHQQLHQEATAQFPDRALGESFGPAALEAHHRVFRTRPGSRTDFAPSPDGSAHA